MLDADKSNRGIRKALFSVAGRTGQPDKSHHKILCPCLL
nr:MAG TPA: hypothetical protein [Bacteriophage sp.]